MRTVLAILVAAVLAGPAAAAQPRAAATGWQDAYGQQLDELFAELKRERNEQAARRIATRIRARWRNSGSATADLLMARADAAMEARKFNVALDLLDQVVVLFPGYAEGWNRRATLHYTMNDFAKAMADISRTLELEPRHFGALAGMAGILKETGRQKMALEAYRRVLEIYPMLRSAQREVTRLSDKLTGDGI